MKYLAVILLSISVVSFAAENSDKLEREIAKRKPAAAANITVYSIQGSDVPGEKWVDETTGVVCYVAHHSGAAISCIKVNLSK